jgi:hypothetical protein
MNAQFNALVNYEDDGNEPMEILSGDGKLCVLDIVIVVSINEGEISEWSSWSSYK